jgi:tRNA (mo5U34)-methyltransferase
VNAVPRPALDTSAEAMQEQVEALGPWFHNLHLPFGIQTAPRHFLGGDFPRFKWLQIQGHIPQDLSGWRVLDVGCNAGFYTFELARRGASVLAMDHDPRYLAQAEWAADVLGLRGRIEFRCQGVYDLAQCTERFDLVWFMGVFYHLRYPLLGLDLLARMTRRLMVFQTLTLPGEAVAPQALDLPIEDRAPLQADGWPRMAFIEHRFANDPTNWWIANHAGCEAMLRSAGLRILGRPGGEIYLCEPGEADPMGRRQLEELLQGMRRP